MKTFFSTARSSNRGDRDSDLRTKKRDHREASSSSRSDSSYRGNSSSRGGSSRDNKRRKDDEEEDGFDPMDPSSYSDAPRGKIKNIGLFL